MENKAFLSLLVCAKIKKILSKKVKKFVKMWWFFPGCKFLFDLLIFRLKYQRISLASGVKNNSWSQDCKRHSRTKKRRDSNSLRAVPRVRWVTHYWLQMKSCLVCTCYTCVESRQSSAESRIRLNGQKLCKATSDHLCYMCHIFLKNEVWYNRLLCDSMRCK